MASGRVPDEGVTRNEWLHVRLTPADDQLVEENRGTYSRSAYIRQLIRTDAAARQS